MLGRLKTERLRSEVGLEGQGSSGEVEGGVALRWPLVCDDALRPRAELDEGNVDRTAQGLLRRHLCGRLRPDDVSSIAVRQADPSLSDDDDSLSLHLPDLLMARLAEVADLVDLNRNDVLRDTLLLHVFGRVRYERWTARGIWRPRRKSTIDVRDAYEAGDIRFSLPRGTLAESDDADSVRDDGTDRRADIGADTAADASGGSTRTAFIRAHGKNTNAIRVHLPSRQKAALAEVAGWTGEPVAEYCRRVLMGAI